MQAIRSALLLLPFFWCSANFMMKAGDEGQSAFGDAISLAVTLPDCLLASPDQVIAFMLCSP
jgi:hypothetical protein